MTSDGTLAKPLSSLRLNSRSSSSRIEDDEVIVSFQATNNGSKCPFGNATVNIKLCPGGCIWLQGNSGAGKTTLTTFLAGLSSPKDLSRLDVTARCDWNPKIHPSERCGVLFQQTTLLDALTVAGNVSVALQSCPTKTYAGDSLAPKIKQLLEAVGLDYARDAHKRPTELSGGMARRASLALQLAQRKQVIVLDEPLTGLDEDAAKSVAKELLHLRREFGTALLLISHEPELAKLIMDESPTSSNDSNTTNRTETIVLTPPTTSRQQTSSSSAYRKNALFGISFLDRFLDKLFDYVLYSLPLIVLTFVACGLAISMLSADILQRIDVTDKVVAIVDEEIRPLIKMVTGEEEANPMYLMVAKMKVKGMLNTVIPAAKANLYAIGMAKLFVLEIGPLLTALLLCGRIGGSYAGIVATMQATSQTKLLQTLGINPQSWTFLPAMSAAILACPLLTVIGTWIALILGGMIGPLYEIGTYDYYLETAYDTIFPPLAFNAALQESWFTALVDITTYPPFFLLWKSTTFITIVLGVAETTARLQPDLTPRGVPGVITSSVVVASLLIILADWGFSQWLIQRR